MRRTLIAAGLVLCAVVLYFNLRKSTAAPLKVQARARAALVNAPAIEPVHEVGLEQAPTDIQIRADEPKGNLTLRGSVLDAGDRPAANAIIAIDTTPRRTVTSEIDGTFTVTDLLPRAYTLVARRGALVSASRELQLGTDTAPITLLLRDAPKLEALVLDSDDRHPIANARIEVEEETVAATTDKQGHAALEGLAPGRYVLSAYSEGYTKSRVVVLHRRGTGSSPFLVLLSADAAVHGFVVDAAGEPVRGANVRALRASTFAVDERATGAEVTSDSRKRRARANGCTR